MLKRDFLFTRCRQNEKTKNVVFLAVNPLELFCFIFDYFFAGFFLLGVALFLKFAVHFFVFYYCFLDFCLVNIHAVNDCCACVAVPLNRDRCSFFFLLLVTALCFSLRDLLRMESIFLAVFLFFL